MSAPRPTSPRHRSEPHGTAEVDLWYIWGGPYGACGLRGTGSPSHGAFRVVPGRLIKGRGLGHGIVEDPQTPQTRGAVPPSNG